MNRSIRRGIIAIGIAGVAFLGTACGNDDEQSSGAGNESAAPTTSESTSDTGMADSAATMVGPGCTDYAKQVPEGEGSVQGMAEDPVAVAASNNPLLKTLVQAVSGQLNPNVNLVDTLNGDEFTVFAPVDEAFAKIDAGTIETLKTDANLLTTILTYHVVPGRIEPDAIAGEHATVQGGKVTVSGSGDNLKVNDASVICGGVQTANATVYLIDSVIMAN